MKMLLSMVNMKLRDRYKSLDDLCEDLDVNRREVEGVLASIDYHYEISEPCEINDCAIMAYRTQVFTTRSHVAVVAGLSEGKPQLLGIYDALGERVNAEWQ